jgi:hypothetical protein
MTTPAFNHLITINTFSVDHHLDELQQVATDLRNERTFGSPATPPGPNRLRMAIGSALLNAGSALVGSTLVAGPSRPGIQAR